MPILRYGEHQSIEIEAAQSASTALLGVPRGHAVDDISAAVAWAIDEPIDYPPLRRATTPGDRVVIALSPRLPQAAAVAAVVVEKLVEAGVHPEGITLLTARGPTAGTASDSLHLIEPRLRPYIGQHVHDPDNRSELAYLAASESGRPILISRTLHDGDLVLPIGGVLDTAAAGYFGIHSTLFPTFADADTRARFRSLGSLARSGNYKQKLIDEVNETAWLLGVTFTIQLLPADGFGVLDVLAGQCQAVEEQARVRYAKAWQQPSDLPPASLVVAAMAGDPLTQTWQNLGVALENAGRLVEDGGAVAVCCELECPPGPGLQRIAGAESRQAALGAIRRERPIDALPAAQIAHALDRFTVYLLSRLEPETVEDLDMVPIAAPTELARLARRHQTCTLLANAPCARVE